MSKVKIQGNASGTGVLTVTAPNTDTDRTITLPDADVTLGTDATKLPLAGGTMTGTLNVSESGHNAEIKVGTQSAHLHQGYSGVQFEDRGYIGGYPNDSLGIFYNTYHSSGSKAIETGTAANVQLLNGGIRFQTAPSVSADAAQTFTDAVMINTAGVVSVPNGIELGSGIDATAANTLDDYEEGTFSAVFKVGGTDNVSSTLRADYTKIGRQVTCYYGVSLINSTNGSGALTITGFPFTSSSTKAVNCILSGNDKVNFPNLVGRMNGTTMHFYYHSSSTSSNLTVADGSAMNGNSAGKQFEVQVTYTV